MALYWTKDITIDTENFPPIRLGTFNVRTFFAEGIYTTVAKLKGVENRTALTDVQAKANQLAVEEEVNLRLHRELARRNEPYWRATVKALTLNGDLTKGVTKTKMPAGFSQGFRTR